MVICPNCEHQNPDGAIQCEACYVPLPQMTTCPYCDTPVQTIATFCGQCGASLQSVGSSLPNQSPEVEISPSSSPLPPDPQAKITSSFNSEEMEEPITEPLSPQSPQAPSRAGSTELQVQKASLFHVQTETPIELPQGLDVIHLGKPNNRIPPDIDISGLPHADIVSRIHADIRIEGDSFYLEDVGSSNGTYINHKSLPPGNRHRLRTGDRIALGKGDLVTLIFQLS